MPRADEKAEAVGVSVSTLSRLSSLPDPDRADRQLEPTMAEHSQGASVIPTAPRESSVGRIISDRHRRLFVRRGVRAKAIPWPV